MESFLQKAAGVDGVVSSPPLLVLVSWLRERGCNGKIAQEFIQLRILLYSRL